MGGTFTHRLGFNGNLPAPVPTFSNVRFLIDATGVGDGTTTVTNLGSVGGAGSVNGDAQVQSGKWDFDGTGDFIQFSDDVEWTPAGSAWTIELFGVEYDAIVTDCGIFDHFADTGGKRSWLLHNGSPGDIRFYFMTSSSTADDFSIHTPLTATAYNYAITWDGSKVRGYLDGVYQAGASFAGPWQDAGTTLRLASRGSAVDVAELFMDGRFAAIRMTDEALYTSESTPYTVPSLPLPTS